MEAMVMSETNRKIPMYEHGVCDAKTRVTFVPVRAENETAQQALDRQQEQVEKALQRLIALLARKAARADFDANRKGNEGPRSV
jgi:hypothetical protein